MLAPSMTLAQSADSATHKTFFVPRDGAIGAAFLAASIGLSAFDSRIAHFFQDTSLTHVRAGRVVDGAFSRVNETTLTVGGLAVYAIARATKQQTVADIAFHTALSVAGASLTAQVIRGPLGRVRPQNTTPKFDNQYDFQFMKGFSHFENRAFPSIHSSSGFAAASVLAAETKERNPAIFWYVAIPAYAFALTPGLSRMYLGQHWASDIFAGAFLGTFYGWRIVQYSHSNPTTPIDRFFLGSVNHASVRRSSNGLSIGWSGKF